MKQKNTPTSDIVEGSVPICVEPIEGADLLVSERDTGFSNLHPQNNELVIIYALIHNTGTKHGKGEVTFYELQTVPKWELHKMSM